MGTEKRLTCSPDHRNLASRRVLAQAGFVERHRFDERDADGAVNTVIAHAFDITSGMG